MKKSSQPDEIRKAFFNLAKKYHPDLNSDKREEDKDQAKVKFQEINEAYQILNNKQTKDSYDSMNSKQEGAGKGGGGVFDSSVHAAEREEKDREWRHAGFFKSLKNRYGSERKIEYSEEDYDLDANLRKLEKIKEERR